MTTEPTDDVPHHTIDSSEKQSDQIPDPHLTNLPEPVLATWQQTIPATLLYWAVLPHGSSGSGSGGGTNQPWHGRLAHGVRIESHRGNSGADADVPPAERYALERGWPVDVDHIYLAAARAVDGQRIIVGIEPDRLRRWLADQPVTWSAIWELLPDRLPPGIPALARSADLSLLTGAFEPAARRRARRMLALGLWATGVITVALAVIGAQRTTAWAQRESARIHAETTAELMAFLPPTASDPSTPDERLTMAVRRLAANTDAAGRNGLPVPQVMQRLLQAIPSDVRLQVDSLSVTADRVSMQVRVLDLVSAERVHHAWQQIAPDMHLHAEPLQAQAQDGNALAVISLVGESP